MCETVYGDMHYKDLLGSIVKSRVLYPGPGFLSSATWPLLIIINNYHFILYIFMMEIKHKIMMEEILYHVFLVNFKVYWRQSQVATIIQLICYKLTRKTWNVFIPSIFCFIFIRYMYRIKWYMTRQYISVLEALIPLIRSDQDICGNSSKNVLHLYGCVIDTNQQHNVESSFASK